MVLSYQKGREFNLQKSSIPPTICNDNIDEAPITIDDFTKIQAISKAKILRER